MSLWISTVSAIIRHHPHLWMARLLRFAWLLPIFIFHASRFVMTVMIYDHFWLFMVTLWIFMAIWTSICLNVAFPNARQIEAKVLASHLGLSAWVGWGKHVSWVAWGFVFYFGLALGLWVFVWFRNWCHVDTSWKRCSNQSCTFKRVCLYLESISIPYQVLEFYIQKIVDTVSWVTQQLRYQYHLNWSI